MEFKRSSSRHVIIAIIIAAIIVAIGLAVGLGVGLGLQKDSCDTAASDSSKNGPTTAPPTTSYPNTNSSNNGPTTAPPTTSQPDTVASLVGDNVNKSASATFKYAAVVADSQIASDIGNDILARKGGNAVDATVAALLATGLMSSHSCGIGGGSFYVIRINEEWLAMDSRETAPAAASENMYVSMKNESLYGGKAVAIPGEIMGLYELHKRFGRVPWKVLVMPSVLLCESGVPITRAVYTALQSLTTDTLKQSFSEYFDNNKTVLPIGTPVKLLKLAQTLRTIADDPMSFYNGSLAADIVSDIQEAGGIITEEDMMNYTVKWTNTSVMDLPNNLTLHSMPPPGSGAVLGFILNILSGYNMTPQSITTEADAILTHHRIVEAMKFAYGKRTNLGDEDFVNVTTDVTEMQSLTYGEETRKRINDSFTQNTSFYNPTYQMNNDQGTAHISVIDGAGNAVSVTSTINTYFGSQVRGNRTGIIFNNEMDDFSTPNTTNYFQLPASPANFIKPGKRPLSSMCPAIVVDRSTGHIKLVAGAAGGSKITTATALNIIDVLWLKMSLQNSVDRPRMHHQLIPVELQMEDNFPKNIREGLEKKGHKTGPTQGISVVQSALILDDKIQAVADFRKGGVPDGY